MSLSTLSLKLKLVILGISFPVVLLGILMTLHYYNAREKTISAYEEKARAICTTAESARMNMEHKWKVGAFNADQLKNWAHEGGEQARDKILEAVPVYSALQAAALMSKQGNYTFKAPIEDQYARNDNNIADPMDLEALEELYKLVEDPNLPNETTREYTTDGGEHYVRYYRAVQLGETCLYCHGDPQNPEHNIWGTSDGTDGLGFAMDNKKVGDIHGAFMIEQSLEVADAELFNEMSLATLAILIGIAGGGLAFSFIIIRVIERPIDDISSNLNEGATQVSSASGQVADSSQSMAQGASQQASSLEQTAAALEQMSSMTQQNADNASQADAKTREVQDAANQSRDSLNRMSTAIEKIQDSSNETAKIIKTIDEIAFQTNLLALNAAVEAARAGEAGKGFTVVAEEVRSLAQRSAAAAKSTADLIKESQENAENGVAVSAEVSEVMSKIIEGMASIATLVNEVSSATTEQSKGIGQIHSAVQHLDSLTQGNAASAEESASVSEELNAQSEELTTMVGHLTKLIKGVKEES